MGTYYYDGQVKFELPWDFEYSKEYNDEGKETYRIKTGSYYNNNGEKCYKFSCVVALHEASEDRPAVFLPDLLKEKFQGESKTRTMMFDGDPEAALVTRGMPMNLFGTILQYYMLIAFVRVGGSKIVSLTTVQTYKEDDEDENLAVFENMATIIRSMSVNGKKNDLQDMGAQALHAALKPCFNEEDNIDIGARLWEMLGGSEEDVSYADQPLPDGVCASEDGYAVINDDWAVRLPDGWVFSTEEEYTSGRPLAAISREEYDESGRGPFDYGDNCFIVFRMAETGSNEYGMHGMLAGLMNSNEKMVVDRLGLRVSYSCRHEESSTYCQFVTVTTHRASYMIQLFYTDEYLGEYGRIGKIEEILNTICLAYEVPYSERYQRREHTKPAATKEKITKKNSVSFKRACPDEKLYPHYHSLLNSPMKSLGFLGVNVVVNSTGTEYAFQGFRSMLNSFSTDPDENLSEEQQNRLTRILNKDISSYDLYKKAKAMQGLFHVDPSVFDPKHDRECELEHGLMHRAYMMSALRSFAWTLSAYCKESGETPATVDYSSIRDLIAYIASHNWLNYDGETYCDGLCGGSDLHVYFVPDSTSAEDRRQLLGGSMSEEEEARIREKFPNFNIIRSQVRSLDALRRDLAYICPAVEKIYDTLRRSRNNKEQLLGDEADILYAWCALALAAKEPFFSEDGPMNCWFEQIESEEEAYRYDNEIYDGEYKSVQDDFCQFDQLEFIVGTNGELKAYCGEKEEVIIPVGVTAIGDNVFYFNKTIKRIVIPYGVMSIGDCAFSKCTGLTSITIPDSVISIGEAAFEDCNNLGSITLPNSITSIGDRVFKGCKKLTDVNVPDRVTSIGDNAFMDCGMLKSIHIPDSVRSIGSWAFYGCAQLTSFTIPNGLKSISDYTFSGCEKLSSISIPKSVKKIGEYAFFQCAELTNVSIPNGVTTIEHCAFASCKKLTICIPKSVVSIGEDAFSFGTKYAVVVPGSDAEGYMYANGIECGYADGAKKSEPVKLVAKRGMVDKYGYFKSYKEQKPDIILPDGVIAIGSKAFKDNLTIKTVIIPEGVTSIGKEAFAWCKNLKSITIPSSVKTIDNEAFAHCKELEYVTIPDGVEFIGNSAFAGCDKLESITIPGSVKKIGEFAFSSCENLKNITVCEGVTKIDKWAFCRYLGLECITLPQSLKSIGASVFSSCVKLKDITIPDGVTIIGEYAFEECSELESITIPQGVKSIKDNTFRECVNLENITFPKGLTSIGLRAFMGCKRLKNITIPDKVTTIAKSCFEGCAELHSVVMPAGVKTIGDLAFYGCCNLKEITIPARVKSIGTRAFHDCTSLTKVTIPASLEEIGELCFFGCSNLEYAVVPKGNCAERYFEEEGIEYRHVGEETAPGKISGSQRKEVFWMDPDGVFKGYFGPQTQIVLPDTVKTIGKYCALSDNLDSITIPGSVKTIEERAFYKCKNLKSVMLSAGAESIGSHAFSNCDALESVTILDGVKTIGSEAFYDCKKLTNVTIPASVTTIGYYAFLGAGSVTITAPEDSFALMYAKEKKIPFVIVETEESRKRKEAAEAAEAERKRKEAEAAAEAERKRKEAEAAAEAERKRKEAEAAAEAERKRKEAEAAAEAERKRKEAEDAERRRREEEANLRALQAARKAVEEERKRKEEEERRKREYEERCRREAEERARKAAEEAEQRRKAAEEAERKRQAELVEKRSRYDALQKNISEQEQIIAENRGWFGAQAKARKAAKEQLASLQAQLNREFPNGRP